MIMLILLVCVLMFYWQGRRPKKGSGATLSDKAVSPAPLARHPSPGPEPPPPPLDDGRASMKKHRGSRVRWRRIYLWLALLAFLAAVVLLVWAAREVQDHDRAIFMMSVSIWLLLLAGIVFVGELMWHGLTLASVSNKDDVDGA